MRPQVSVIMPVYNAEKYVKNAIASILSQSYQNFELIIIDDGSNDRSAILIKEFVDSRVVFIQNQDNHGLIYSLNLGLKLAKGDFIARMDADDLAFETRLEKQVEFLCSNPEVGVIGSYFQTLGFKDQIFAHPVKHSDILFKMLFFGNSIGHPTVMMRSSLFQGEIAYDSNFKNIEDFKLWSDLSLNTQFHNLPEVLLEYRLHENQISQKFANEQRIKSDEIRLSLFSKLFELQEISQNDTKLAVLLNLRDNDFSFDFQKTIDLLNQLLSINNSKKLFKPNILKNRLIKNLIRRIIQDKKLPKAEKVKFIVILAKRFPLSLVRITFMKPVRISIRFKS